MLLLFLSCLDKPDVDTLATVYVQEKAKKIRREKKLIFSQSKWYRTNADKQSKAKYLFSIY